MDQTKAATLIQRTWQKYRLRYCYRCKSPHRTYYVYCPACLAYVRKVEDENCKWRYRGGPVPTEILHYCNDYDCTGDCGELDCGCIDICRGRCGFRRSAWD
jgi:hypothetical protein